MAGLWISNVDVHDPDEYSKYVEGSSRVIPSYGGEFVARGGRYQQLEGKEYARNVVVRFPSFERAVECYYSPEYQEIVGQAMASASRQIVVVETLE